jgi:hypothetical protein
VGLADFPGDIVLEKEQPDDFHPVAKKLGINKRIGWHTFRHYADPLTMPGESWIE